MTTSKKINAKRISRIVGTSGNHLLYSETGRWYNCLTDFPGVLFDRYGYIIFQTESDYLSCQYLRHGKRLNIPEGISSINGIVTLQRKN